MQVQQVRQLLSADQAQRRALSAGPGSPSGSVDEQLGLGREVKVDDVVQEGYVQTPGRDIRGYQNGRLPRPELANVYLSCSLQEKSLFQLGSVTQHFYEQFTTNRHFCQLSPTTTAMTTKKLLCGHQHILTHGSVPLLLIVQD